jgi:hypothetical protein
MQTSEEYKSAKYEWLGSIPSQWSSKLRHISKLTHIPKFTNLSKGVFYGRNG